LAGVPEKSVASAPRKPKIQKVDPETLLQFPWLAEYLDQKTETQPSGEKARRSVEHPPPDQDDDEDVLPMIEEALLESSFKRLMEKRLEWEAAYEGMAEDFEVIVRGGPWTEKHIGRVTDVIRAQPVSKEAKKWCELYGIVPSASFSIKRYTEAGASAMALAWVHRMQYFYDVYKDSDQSRYQYTAEDIAQYVEDEPFVDYQLTLPLEGGHAYDRAKQVKSIMPTNPSAAVASGSVE